MIVYNHNTYPTPCVNITGFYCIKIYISKKLDIILRLFPEKIEIKF